MSLPDREISAILKKFGPEITEYLKTVGFFDITGPYEPTDILNARAMAAYRKASIAKNRDVWAALEKWLFPEMVDFGAAFIKTYGLKPPINVEKMATEYIAKRGGELIKKMTQTDQKRLVQYIHANSMKNERPLARQIAKEPGLASLVSGHRTATIIRTERNHAIGDSAYQMADKAGATFKIRHEVGDHRTRPSHRKMMGEKVKLDEPYSNGEMFPGETDINCRGFSEYSFDKAIAEHPHPSMAKLEELYGDVTPGQKARAVAPEPIQVAPVKAKMPEFVPAKTTKEAEAWAKSNILNPSEVKRFDDWNAGENHQQIKYISYRGIDVNVANIVNKRLYENINLFGINRPGKILATGVRDKSWLMQVAGDKIEINSTRMGSLEKVSAMAKDHQKLYGPGGRDLLEKVSKSEMANATAHGKALISQLKRRLQYSREIVGAESAEQHLISCIDHETAHLMVRHGKHGYDTPTHEAFLKDMIQTEKTVKSSEYKYKLSYYGSESYKSEECYAEFFSAYRKGERDTLHPDAIKFLNKYFPEMG